MDITLSRGKMKGIMMYNHMNDLVFSQIDENLIERLYQLGQRDKLIEKTDAATFTEATFNKDVIVQIFSPLIASYKVMQGQFGRRYQSIETEDGTILVFKKILNYVVIGVTSEDKGLDVAQKEINMFLAFVKMFYGPALHLLNENITTYSGYHYQDVICKLLNEWHITRKECQMFLVEAVERLLLNPDIAAVCVNLLQEVLQKARTCPMEGTFNHSFLLVDYKLLALYSSRNSAQLPKKCVLLLMLLAKVVNANSGPHASKSTSSRPEETTSHVKASDSAKDKMHIQRFVVFLPSQEDDLVPYRVHILRISQKVTLILLCELIGKSSLSRNLMCLVKLLDNLQSHPSSQQKLCSPERLENAFQNVVTALEKLLLPDDCGRYLKLLIIKWEQMKQFGIVEYLQSSQCRLLDSKLESIISSVCEICKLVFGEAILRQALKSDANSDQIRQIFFEIKKMSSKRLKDCIPYLEAKAEQNITMSSYVAEFPGLIHFIYVDRNSDCMIAPSVVLTEGHLKGTASLKNKIWKMVDFGRKYVNGSNSFLFTWHHDDLRYFYSIWFEDSNGRNIKPTRHVDLQGLPELICRNFFKELIKKCFPDASYEHICCYELFCVHLATISPADVIEQSKRLAAQLWEFSGAHRVSLDLL